jgi:hypothetical protein
MRKGRPETGNGRRWDEEKVRRWEVEEREAVFNLKEMLSGLPLIDEIMVAGN